MSKLEAPLRQSLTESVDEQTVQRIWSAVRARREGKRPARPVWSYALAASLALIVAFVAWRQLLAPPRQVAAGPITGRDGAALSVLGVTQELRAELSDGSSINLDAGARLEVLENTSTSFVSVLRRGHGSFSVQPGGPRRWTIEAGLLTVEVVGTRFSVTRRADAVEVTVEHGIVVVRGELVRDRVQRLTAGQTLSVALPSSAPLVAEPPPSVTPPAPSSAPVVAPRSLEQLLAGANELRKRGDIREAEVSLRRALREHPSEPQTALVAFTLGKLLLDNAGRPADAALAFQHCLAASPPSALAEDALFRLAQAQSKAGDEQGAAASARRYVSTYPNGQHLADVSQWVDAP